MTDGDRASWVGQQLEATDSVAAPELFDLEVLNALRRLVGAGSLTIARAAKAVTRLFELPVLRMPHLPLAERIWELRAHMTPYDASYIALAEQLDAELVTTDARLARARGHRARVTAFPG